MGADQCSEIERMLDVAGVTARFAVQAARVRSPWPDLSQAQAQRVLDYLYSQCWWDGSKWERR